MKSKLPFLSLLRIIFEGKTSVRFLAGAIGSLSFSIAVILCTIGLMDGFEFTLKKSLADANGDLKITSSYGFYLNDDQLKKTFEKIDPLAYSSLLQIEGFAAIEGLSKGVLLKGIKTESFANVTKIDLRKLKTGVLVGEILAKKLALNIGDEIRIILPSESAKSQGGAILETFIVDDIIKHGIYEKDLRFVYIKKERLSKLLGYRSGSTNMSLIKLKNFDNLEHASRILRVKLGEQFSVEPFWAEFEVLLDAVKVEKYSISIVLQLIVLVAILNIAAFVIFISEKKSQDFFMLRAMGLSVNAIGRFWYLTLGAIWFISCGVGLLLTFIFNTVILKLPFLKVPGDIYVLSDLEIILDQSDFLLVFSISLLWVMLMGMVTMFRVKSKTVISGLRQEFS